MSFLAGTIKPLRVSFESDCCEEINSINRKASFLCFELLESAYPEASILTTEPFVPPGKLVISHTN